MGELSALCPSRQPPLSSFVHALKLRIRSVASLLTTFKVSRMDDLERSSKRQHSKTPAATALRKHDIIWFNDGNIVLQAEQMQFLVHRSVLALHSVVFKDMFSLPPPPIPANETKLEELHPTVQMHDSAVDVENMLSALYGQRCELFC